MPIRNYWAIDLHILAMLHMLSIGMGAFTSADLLEQWPLLKWLQATWIVPFAFVRSAFKVSFLPNLPVYVFVMSLCGASAFCMICMFTPLLPFTFSLQQGQSFIICTYLAMPIMVFVGSILYMLGMVFKIFEYENANLRAYSACQLLASTLLTAWLSAFLGGLFYSSASFKPLSPYTPLSKKLSWRHKTNSLVNLLFHPYLYDEEESLNAIRWIALQDCVTKAMFRDAFQPVNFEHIIKNFERKTGEVEVCLGRVF